MIEVIKKLIGVFFFLFYRVSIVNMENVPKKGAVLLCSNHIGEFDMFAIGFRLKRLVRWIAKVELFKNPLLGALFKWVGAVPVKRGKADISFVKTIYRLLEEGEIVGIFPEGTRTRGRTGENIKINPGAAMFAVKTGVPILPVAIDSTYRPFSKIKVIFGKPFLVDIEKGKKYTNDELIQISEKIMVRVYSLLED